jgi:hypothetical protein
MPQWTDALGTVWQPRITLGIVRRFELLTGIGLMSAGGWRALGENVGHQVALAWLACEAQAAELKVTQEDFERRLILGDVVPITMETLADFFQRQRLMPAAAVAELTAALRAALGPGSTSPASPLSPA